MSLPTRLSSKENEDERRKRDPKRRGNAANEVHNEGTLAADTIGSEISKYLLFMVI